MARGDDSGPQLTGDPAVRSSGDGDILMILEWLFGFTLTRFADSQLDRTLERKLTRVADEWAAALPDGFALDSRALFRHSVEIESVGPMRIRLQNSLRQNASAPIQFWTAALQEQWRHVGAVLGEDRDEFFRKP